MAEREYIYIGLVSTLVSIVRAILSVYVCNIEPQPHPARHITRKRDSEQFHMNSHYLLQFFLGLSLCIHHYPASILNILSLSFPRQNTCGGFIYLSTFELSIKQSEKCRGFHTLAQEIQPRANTVDFCQEKRETKH